VGNPPEKFAAVFARARAAGLHAVAHAGEEGPPAYIAEALDLLGAERVDHGVRCLEDPGLVQRLVRERVCLTVCPLSNVALRVVDRIEDHPLRRMLDRGLSVTVNSDDPAYFGGDILENFLAVAQALRLSDAQLVALARNAIDGSFAEATRKDELRAELELAAQ
jgi:adenosine deaminase